MKTVYLKKAEENLPKLHKTEIRPAILPTVMKTGDRLTVDLGAHFVGYLSFKMGYDDMYIDAPVRMQVRFSEVARELDDDPDTYCGGLSRSWLQDETVNIDFPGIYRMPRRYAARYITIRILCSPQKLVLSDFLFEAQTSADPALCPPCTASDPALFALDTIAVSTLKSCMQRVFEDGPKRDRRLWTGDLRLEALTSYYTLRSPSLVRRCLYLFAATDPNEYGILPGFLYENPIFVSGKWFLIDYALMFICTLSDFLLHEGDEVTFRDLLPIARRILGALDETKDENGLVTQKTGDVFVDWCKGLQKRSSLVGIYLYTLARFCEALESLGMDEASVYRARLEEGREAAYRYLYDPSAGAFINALDGGQYSVHTAAWMVLGGAVAGEEAKRVLLSALGDGGSVKPFTPYMHHYVTEALVCAGATDEAERYLRKVWGGMARRGGDTFPEVYADDDPDFSPYGDRLVNSMCHAWSCTASYFIRKYGFGKNKASETQKRTE